METEIVEKYANEIYNEVSPYNNLHFNALKYKLRLLYREAEKANRAETLVICFARFLRALRENPLISWTDEMIKEYDEDKSFINQIYREQRIKMGFGDAYEFALTKLYERILGHNI